MLPASQMPPKLLADYFTNGTLASCAFERVDKLAMTLRWQENRQMLMHPATALGFG
jgi:hypothetical protein